MKTLFLLVMLSFFIDGMAQDEAARRRANLERSIGVETHMDTTRVHDPVMIRENGKYYMFTTGWGISVFSSVDKIMWTRERPVFSEAPEWAQATVPDFKGHIWAPDIALYNGQYHLYYSISSFGKNTSAIGVATNKTLDPDSPDFEWVDHGKVIQSIPDQTNWNAIDAHFIQDEAGTPYISFGSFWGGLMLAQLTPDGLSLAQEVEDLTVLATRPLSTNAIEAPFIIQKEGFYYLFASFDFCCRGAESTYKVVVGRSEKLAGEYLDAQGQSMLEGGGTLVVEGGERYAGAGHNAVVSFDGVDYLVFHAYDMTHDGQSFLRILPITWDNGWPKVAAQF
ncbi:MAG: arabinan endo-1,5-alpha-L-arabinosidase [Bacteroidales bacterium]|nr:arabinan endo-1,5-alpha-L-arabinosidase [Bacteroidales bacterium]